MRYSRRVKRILISACLLGERVRYDGGDKALAHPSIDHWRGEGRLVPLCPEVAGGLPVPRPPAEISAGTGMEVLAHKADVVTAQGHEVSAAFVAGAHAALALAQARGCAFALLTDGSPSCGVTWIYDGQFRHNHRAGMGVTAALLASRGIRVFAPSELDRLRQAVQDAESV